MTILHALVVMLALSVLSGPVAAEAQEPPRAPRIGVLEANPGFATAFHEGLRQVGYVEGKNIAIEWRWAHAKAERFSELAVELVRLNVDVIVATNNAAVAAAQKATRKIPIVMVIPTDPVRLGFVASLGRPAGNITGLTIQAPELAGKRLQLLNEAVPHLTRVAVLWDSTEPGRRQLVEETEVAAPKLGLKLQTLEIRNPARSETQARSEEHSQLSAKRARGQFSSTAVRCSMPTELRSQNSRQRAACRRCAQRQSGWTPASSWPIAQV